MAEILVVDDEPQMRRLRVRVLNGADHGVHEAEIASPRTACLEVPSGEAIVSAMTADQPYAG
jgi:CheY-like chemotaxis protein